MIELNMSIIDEKCYLEYETQILNKVEFGILTMYEAAKLIDEYLKALGY